jgi:hypothetical protein
MNADLVLQLAILAISRSQELMALYAKSRAEGRDITDDELAGIRQSAIDANERLKALG